MVDGAPCDCAGPLSGADASVVSRKAGETTEPFLKMKVIPMTLFDAASSKSRSMCVQRSFQGFEPK
jgi:hypothetical protein